MGLHECETILADENFVQLPVVVWIGLIFLALDAAGIGSLVLETRTSLNKSSSYWDIFRSFKSGVWAIVWFRLVKKLSDSLLVCLSKA
ncbi:hypothetical protein BpHYR1_017371 [Brachionus plicatilis]|uniref:Uncharacterized protein n=1 Tax=Brachionus plicatilis TaxID=10195 RepID=A0A3M7QVC8_BRAPC|nr:hypothetical protein BpHYR1_017371 [Brachionus plicatilis]